MMPLGVVASSVVPPATVPFLDGSLGGVTTPDTADLTITATELTFTARCVVPSATGANRFLAAQWGSVSAEQAWLWFIGSTGVMSLNLRTPSGLERGGTFLTAGEVTALGAEAVHLGARVTQLASDTPPRIAGIQSTDDGATWDEIGSPVFGAATWPGGRDATIGVGVSCRPSTLADKWAQPLYWAQMSVGSPDPNAGTLVWRFDAAEYPGTGTSYADPRGRTWTLSAPGVIHT